MTSFLNFNGLNAYQKDQYNLAISKAFPQIISESQVIKKNWSKLESYFPEYQQFLISKEGEVIGFINALPFYFQDPISELPDRGWDWMFEKGISDFEHKIKPNYLGGLQVIVRSKYQKLGYSRQIIDQAKRIFKASSFLNLLIPIRPTKKHEFPKMPMATYLGLQTKDEVYDPWIRTHLRGGAQIIKVCERSMTMQGDIAFWESMLGKKIYKSGEYQLKGALALITIDIENNMGQYVEPNIWIKYE